MSKNGRNWIIGISAALVVILLAATWKWWVLLFIGGAISHEDRQYERALEEMGTRGEEVARNFLEPRVGGFADLSYDSEVYPAGEVEIAVRDLDKEYITQAMTAYQDLSEPWQ